LIQQYFRYDLNLVKWRNLVINI